MNLFTNIALVFVFIFLSIIIGLPDFTHNDNLIKNKMFLFIGIFAFQFLIKSIYKLKNKGTKNINIKCIFNEAVLVALFSIIGMSLYFDILNIENYRNNITSYIDIENINSRTFLISLIISIFMFVSIGINKIINNNNEK